MTRWLDLAERLVSAMERLAASHEQREAPARPRVVRRGLRASRKKHSEVLVPTELDRARASKALKKLGF
jgi:hypothetical protein